MTIPGPVRLRRPRQVWRACTQGARCPSGHAARCRYALLTHLLPLLRRVALLAGLGALLAAVLAPAAGAAPTTISTEPRATPIAAWAGTVVWSSFDATTNDYHLVVSRNGAAPQRLPVAPSANAFDVDLGTNRSGSTYAVYSRCTTPATQNTPPTGCDLYRLSIASGIETKLDTLSSPTWDEREPTIYRGEIAFIRDETHGGRNEDVLRIGNTTSGAQGTTALVVRNRLGGSLQDPELREPPRLHPVQPQRDGPRRPCAHAEGGRERQAGLPGEVRRRELREHHRSVAERHGRLVHVGPHEQRLRDRQPDRPIHDQLGQARLRDRLAPVPVHGVGEPGVRHRRRRRPVGDRRVLAERERPGRLHGAAHRAAALRRQALSTRNDGGRDRAGDPGRGRTFSGRNLPPPADGQNARESEGSDAEPRPRRRPASRAYSPASSLSPSARTSRTAIAPPPAATTSRSPSTATTSPAPRPGRRRAGRRRGSGPRRPGRSSTRPDADGPADQVVHAGTGGTSRPRPGRGRTSSRRWRRPRSARSWVPRRRGRGRRPRHRVEPIGKSLSKYRLPSVSSGVTSTSLVISTGPVSSPSSGQKIARPVWRRPG